MTPLVEVPPNGKQHGIGCESDERDPERCACRIFEFDSWPRTEQAEHFRTLRIELRLGLGAAARATGLDIEVVGGLERGKYAPEDPATGWPELCAALRAHAEGPAPIPEGLL